MTKSSASQRTHRDAITAELRQGILSKDRFAFLKQQLSKLDMETDATPKSPSGKEIMRERLLTDKAEIEDQIAKGISDQRRLMFLKHQLCEIERT